MAEENKLETALAALAGLPEQEVVRRASVVFEAVKPIMDELFIGLNEPAINEITLDAALKAVAIGMIAPKPTPKKR